MKTNLLKILIVALIIFLIDIKLFAQQKSEEENAASNATNPLAFVTKLQFQPNYVFKDPKGDQLSLINRLIQPTATIGLPFIKSKNPKKVYTIYRLEVPVISQTISDSQSVLNATGLSDLVFLDAIAFKHKWGLLGIGPALIIPAASPEIFGSGKWSAGPVAVLLYTKTKGMQLGALVQQFFSFAGSETREDQNFMFFQPIFNLIFGKGYFLQFSPIMKFDWKKVEYSVPVSPAFGRAFAKNLSMSIAPEYVISGPAQGDFAIKLNINVMFVPLL